MNTEIEAKDYYSVMVHFYRGELGRIMIWRQRLDITTNWAIIGTTGMVTFGLGSPSNTHLIFLFWILFGGIHLAIITLTVLSLCMREESGEFGSTPMRRQKWKF